MSESQTFIQGFETTRGIMKYDYNALGNLPSIMRLVFCTTTTIPNPNKNYLGFVALIENEETKTETPCICLQRKNGGYVWVSFDGNFNYGTQKLDTPEIELIEIEKLDKPEIYIDVTKLDNPEIYIDSEKLDAPIIRQVEVEE